MDREREMEIEWVGGLVEHWKGMYLSLQAFTLAWVVMTEAVSAAALSLPVYKHRSH